MIGSMNVGRRFVGEQEKPLILDVIKSRASEKLALKLSCGFFAHSAA